MTFQPNEIRGSQDLATRVRPIYTQFLKDLNHTQPCIRIESEKLMESMLEFAQGTGVPHRRNSHSYQCLMVGYSYADNCFPYHHLEVKVFVAIYTWLVILCDDAESLGTVTDLENFQKRWVMNETQPSLVLESFAEQLRLSYKYYHQLVANLIVTASLNFLTSAAIAAREGIKSKMGSSSKGGQNFPWYIREKDSIGEGYAWFTFPKAQYPNIDIPAEAISDMTRFLALTNDILSFYKEEISGETDNYIHRKSAYQEGNAISALENTAQDAIDSLQRVELVLADCCTRATAAPGPRAQARTRIKLPPWELLPRLDSSYK